MRFGPGFDCTYTANGCVDKPKSCSEIEDQPTCAQDFGLNCVWYDNDCIDTPHSCDEIGKDEAKCGRANEFGLNCVYNEDMNCVDPPPEKFASC